MTVEAKGKPPGPSRREGREGNSLCVAASEAALDVSRSVKLGSCTFFSFSRVSCVCAVASGVSDSGQPCGPSPTRLLCPRILQARAVQWVAMSSSRGSSQPRARTRISCVSCIAGRLSTTAATGEAPHIYYQPACTLNSLVVLWGTDCQFRWLGIVLDNQLLSYSTFYLYLKFILSHMLKLLNYLLALCFKICYSHRALQTRKEGSIVDDQ